MAMSSARGSERGRGSARGSGKGNERGSDRGTKVRSSPPATEGVMNGFTDQGVGGTKLDATGQVLAGVPKNPVAPNTQHRANVRAHLPRKE
jgi:hypothetical protein